MELDKELFSVTIYLLTPKLLIGNPIFWIIIGVFLILRYRQTIREVACERAAMREEKRLPFAGYPWSNFWNSLLTIFK